MISSKEEGKLMARWGYYAAFANALFTALLVIARYGLSGIGPSRLFSYWSLVDVLLFICVGIGIRKMSKTAAVGGLLLYILEIAGTLYQRGAAAFTAVQILWSVLFVLAFIQGLRGTFAYHAQLQTEGTEFEVASSRVIASWIWRMPDRASARTAVKVGSLVCILIAADIAGFGVYALATHRTFEGYDAWVLVDAALFSIIAWRLWNNSRVWAVVGLILEGLEIVDKLQKHISTFGVITVLLFFAILNATRGTFVLHKLSRAQQGSENAMP
jgi:hypothetical protein